jgi:hypothetical protein
MSKIKLLAAALLATMLCAAAARADEAAADTATARALGVEGVSLAEAGKCGEAIEKLERAEKLHHAPTTATRLAECEIETGKLLLGTERLQRVVRERLPANAHPAFAQAQTRAQALLDKTLPKLATVRVGFVGSNRPVPSTVAITVDGEKTSADAIVDTDRKIDPGSHMVEVKAEGFLPAKESNVVLREGEAKSIRFELKRDPSWRPPPHPTPSERAARDEGTGGATTASRRGFSKAPAVVAFGLSAVGLGLGIYSAMVVDDKSSRLQNECDANRVCPPELQRDISDAKTWATVSTASFIGAGVFAATGITLFVLSTPSNNGGGGTNRATTPAPGVRLRPTASGALLDGVF